VSFVLKLHGVIVGRSDLEDRDPAARVARGTFRPGAGYELVEPIFALARGDSDVEAARYRKARNALELELFDGQGARIATSSVEIEGAGTAGHALRLRAAITDPDFWSLRRT
jgi:hypothetical protein